VFSRIYGGGNSGGASFHAPPLENLKKTGVPGASSSPLHFSVGGDTHRYLHKKKKHKPVDFTSSFLHICFWFHFSSPPETILL
jgi:hypothetical protein